jgi:prevent-host-death family protein
MPTGKPVNIHEAKTHFSKLVSRVEAGEEVIIARGGKPVAKLVPVALPKKVPAPFGFAKGSVLYIADDFDAPDPEFEDLFYNGPLMTPAEESPSESADRRASGPVAHERRSAPPSKDS